MHRSVHRRRVRLARDYNRAVAAPVRWGHILVAMGADAAWRAGAWTTAPGRVTWAPYLLAAVVAVVLLVPLDGTVSRWLSSLELRGDIRREVHAAQQYGQLLSSVLVGLVIWFQDPARRRRLADWALAFAITGVLTTFFKMTVGRPRPLLGEPGVFLGPLGTFSLPDVGERHAWEIWGGISSQLWSMPSSHTAHMAVMALFLAVVYPRLRYIAFGMLVVVGMARVMTGAHYLTDVIAGAALGLAVCHTVVTLRCGQRVVDRLAGRGDDDLRRSGASAVGESALPGLPESPSASVRKELQREVSSSSPAGHHR